jgi:hypothetical protein
MSKYDVQHMLQGGDSVPTSVPTTGQSTLTQGVTAPTVPTGLEQENLLMQHYHYQYLQRQFLLRYGKLALDDWVGGKR